MSGTKTTHRHPDLELRQRVLCRGGYPGHERLFPPERPPAAWCTTKGCSTAGSLTKSATWRAGCTQSPMRSGPIWTPSPQSPSSCASICTTWATAWVGWRATSAWPGNTPSTRAALCGTTWTRPSGSRACRAAVWAMAATLESAPPTMRSAPTASSLQTGRRSPPCRICATGTTPPPVGLPGTQRMPARLRPVRCLPCGPAAP